MLRKDWLDNVGMQVPKTLDDFYKVLKAFVNNDPDKNGKADNSRRVWTVYTFLIWYRQFFGENAPKAA